MVRIKMSDSDTFEEADIVDSIGTVEKQETELKCYECSKEFIYSTHLREHMKIEHGKEEAFQCHICFKTFKQLSAVNFHLKQMHSDNKQNFNCTVCPASFKTSVKFRLHMKGEHNQENVFPCPNCSKSFKEARSVNLHVRKVHRNERPFVCNFCSKSFQVAGNLERHVKGTHLKEKNFLCQECPQRFSQKATLLIHIRGVHAKEKPFQCSQCSSRFLTLQKLTEHVNYAHKGITNFLCHLCPGKFANKQNLGTHVKNVHSTEKQRKKSAGTKPRAPRKRKMADQPEHDSTQHQGSELKDNSTEVVVDPKPPPPYNIRDSTESYIQPAQQHSDMKDSSIESCSRHSNENCEKTEIIYCPDPREQQQQSFEEIAGPAKSPTRLVCMVDIKEENLDSPESNYSDDDSENQDDVLQHEDELDNDLQNENEPDIYPVNAVEAVEEISEMCATDLAVNQLDASLKYRVYHAFKDLTQSDILTLIGKQVLSRSQLITIILGADKANLTTCQFIGAIIQTFQNQ